MNHQERDYLSGERNTGLFLLCWGALSGTAIYILDQLPAGTFEEGLCASFFPLALLQLVKGGLMFFNWHRLRPDFEGGSRSKSAERPRIEKAAQINQFERILEFVLIAVGMGFALLGSIGNWSEYYLSMGIGMMVQAALLFAANLFTGFRLSIYQHYLER